VLTRGELCGQQAATPADGRVFRTLNIIDDFSREWVAIEVDTPLGGQRVARVLDRLKEQRGPFRAHRDGQRPGKFTSKALDSWAHAAGVLTDEGRIYDSWIGQEVLGSPEIRKAYLESS
jgi:transposase InsO family protein